MLSDLWIRLGEAEGSTARFRVSGDLARRFGQNSPAGHARPKATEMHIPHDALMLPFFPSESERWHHQPLYEAIVLKAREMHRTGATALRGAMDFGKSSRLHTAQLLRLSMDLPLVIEIADSEHKVCEFLPVLDERMKGGLGSQERMRVIDYRADPDAAEPPEI